MENDRRRVGEVCLIDSAAVSPMLRLLAEGVCSTGGRLLLLLPHRLLLIRLLLPDPPKPVTGSTALLPVALDVSTSIWFEEFY